MKKFMRIFTAIAVGIVAVFSLASCKKATFYSEWHGAGATIEEDNVFKYLTIDEVAEKKAAKEEFVVFIGTSESETARTLVSNIQTQADLLDFTGNVYVVSVKNILGSINKMNDARTKLGTKEINPGDNGLIAVCYKNNAVHFDTSNPNEELKRFYVDGAVNFNSIAVYSFELYNSQNK